MDAAVAALVGAAIGAVGSLGGTWIQQRHQSRRDRMKTASELGLADFNFKVELVKQKGGPVAPLSLFVAYHLEVLDALESKDFKPERIRTIRAKQREIIAAIRSIDDETSGS